MKKLFALVDCSAFYCSCERAFRPDLKNKPVCVLSNNDGCVVSLTPEVKELGIGIGTPFYQVKKTLEEFKVSVFSSNYCLYSDMSRRVMQVIERFSGQIEQCSIDEVFVEFDVNENDIEHERIRLTLLAEELHKAVLKGTGIPVRVSIAETKTLAKVGSEYAKKLLKAGKLPCVCFWEHPDKINFLQNLSVADVWGVGRKWSKKLQDEGYKTAYDFSLVDHKAIKKTSNIILEKTVLELQGVSCIPLDFNYEQRKSMIRSRMFGQKLNDPKLIRAAVATHIARAAEKLREENIVTGMITVFISTGRHAEVRHYGHASAHLMRPTSDTFMLQKVAHNLFRKCYKSKTPKGDEFKYVKAGIIFHELAENTGQQISLFDFINDEKTEIMDSLDTINKKYGPHSVVFASQGTPDSLRGIKAAKKDGAKWGMKRNLMSPRYTSVWAELLEVKIG
ncbi:MAG: Y-family DNA polymerase [Patescibacteria group bacterium]